MSNNAAINYEALVLTTLDQDGVIYHNDITSILDTLRTSRRESGLENPSVSEMVRSFMGAIDTLVESGAVKTLSYTTPSSPGRMKIAVVFNRDCKLTLRGGRLD